MIPLLFGRLSTGLKMLLILSAALLPLGLIAVFASLESARTNRLTREADVRMIAVDGGRRLGNAVAGGGASLRLAVEGGPVWRDAGACGRTLDAIVAAQKLPVSIGLFDVEGRRLCATPHLTKSPVTAPAAGIGTEVRLLAPAAVLRFTLGGLPDDIRAVGELPRETLAALVTPPRGGAGYGERLREGDATIDLAQQSATASPLGQTIAVVVPVSNGQLSLELRSPPTPIRAIEVLMILLPILMWLAAAIIGWLVMDRLVLAPLGQLQRAIAAYSPDDGASLHLPVLTTPSQEIRRLGESFAAVAHTVALHQAQLESGLARQTKLTREVHHRVKNNLQVVSSLINLHSRGVTNPDVGAAYASIQRRVDALAVVHRNHYAELEENRGVGLRPLLGELASNLRATAPPEASHLAIALDLVPAFVSQDVAVPVAFLITELVELAMSCDPTGDVAIAVAATEKPDRATLSIFADGLKTDACRNHPALERSSRVIEGLSRQLRAPLRRGDDGATYALEIGIIPPVDRPAA